MSEISEDSWSMASGSSTQAFKRAKLDMLAPEKDQEIKTLPELVEFNARHNPDYLFCLQATKNFDLPETKPEDRFLRITHRDVKLAIVRCQRWLSTQVTVLTKPQANADGSITKCPPIAIYMESDVGLFIYLTALVGMGVPVANLSARLSPNAIENLLVKTGAKSVLTSQRLRRNVDEAVGSIDGQDGRPDVFLRQDFTDFLKHEEGAATSEESICAENYYIGEKDRSVLILHSSGTTGLPKPIYTTHRYFLGYAANHELAETESQNVNFSTLPLYHGFGLLAPGLSLSTGLTVCFPPSTIIPNGHATVKLLQYCNAKSIMTVPSILEEIASFPDEEVKAALGSLQFVIWGGGPLKMVVGEKLAEAGIKLLNHSGATEVGALGSVMVPGPDYDWHYIRVRQDFHLDFKEVETPENQPQRFKMVAYPFGWDEVFEVQDQLVTRPENPGREFQILGRNDDLIVLATGEKILPQILESLLSAREDVKAAIAFGEGEFELGVIVEPLADIEIEDAFKDAIWPTIKEAGEKMDGHAQISSKKAVIVVPAGTCARSDKGSIMRKETYKRLDEKIAAAYKDLENSTDGGQAISFSSPTLEKDLKDTIVSVLGWENVESELTFDMDFFELGMDSLQALKLRRALLPSLLKGSASPRSTEQVGRDFLYRNSTITRVADFMRAENDDGDGISRQVVVDSLTETYFATLSLGSDKATILLTGSTGSLGSHLVAYLTGLSNVAKVICLVRAKGNSSSKQTAYDRQIESLKSKRLELSDESLNKVEVIEANAAAANLGLTGYKYKELCDSVTHILHNAWPVDFKRQLPSFEGQFHTISNLVQLARKVKIAHPLTKPKLVFVSSIATVGRYGEKHDVLIVPEVPVEDVDSVNPLGYAEAKLVCEKILDRAAEAYGDELEVQYVRVGQMAGSKVTGYWNSTEHLPALLKSSQKIGALPRIKGTCSWLPVDDAASTMSEILLSNSSDKRVFHMENPVRQPWSDLLEVLAAELQIDTLIPMSEWAAKVGAVSDDAGAENPAKQLLGFFEYDFEHNATGGVIMDTAQARDVAPTLANMYTVSEQTVKDYVSYWRSTGFLSS